MERNKYVFLVLVMLAIKLPLFAQQQYRYKAELSNAPTSGFYRIPLQPDVLFSANPLLSDLRISTDDGKFVPYAFGSLIPKLKGQGKFLPFMMARPIEIDTATIFIIQNTSPYAIEHLCLHANKISQPQRATLAGSYDLKTWFTISNELLIGKSNNRQEELINFPANTYKYFKLKLNTTQTERYSLLGVGVYQPLAVADPVYVEYPAATVTQIDSGSVSRIRLNFKHKFRIDKLKLNINSTEPYRRRFAIYQSAVKLYEQLYSGELASTTPTEYKFAAKTDNLFIEVENGNKAPLALGGASAYSLEQSIVAYLEAGKQYRLLMGCDTARRPAYDLSPFTDMQPNAPQRLVHQDVEPNLPTIKNSDAGSISTLTWLIGIGTGLAVVIVLLIIYKKSKK